MDSEQGSVFELELEEDGTESNLEFTNRNERELFDDPKTFEPGFDPSQLQHIHLSEEDIMEVEEHMQGFDAAPTGGVSQDSDGKETYGGNRVPPEIYQRSLAMGSINAD